jgi:ribosomal protein L37AE/L43A
MSTVHECAACRKKSDGAKRAADGTWLCGTHFDEYLSTLFPKSSIRGESPAGFAMRLRTTRYAACWAAKEKGHG